MKKLRPLTGVDRMLAHGDRMDRALGEPTSPRRRTHRRFGKLELVVIEKTNEPTIVYLTNGDDGAIVEATASDLVEAAAAVREILADPPTVKRK